MVIKARARYGGDANLLALCIECARARCTLGEMSAAMEDVFGRYDTVPTPVSGPVEPISSGPSAGRWELRHSP